MRRSAIRLRKEPQFSGYRERRNRSGVHILTAADADPCIIAVTFRGLLRRELQLPARSANAFWPIIQKPKTSAVATRAVRSVRTLDRHPYLLSLDCSARIRSSRAALSRIPCPPVSHLTTDVRETPIFPASSA